MKATRKLTHAFFIVAVLAINGCQKETEPNLSTQDNEEFTSFSSQANAESEIMFNDVFDNVIGVNSEVAIGGTGIFAGKNNSSDQNPDLPNGPTEVDSVKCFVVTATSLDQNSSFPVKIEIDFGAGCRGRDGKTRKGKMTTIYSNRLILPGATATTSFENYYVNNVKVEGSHLITNTFSANTPSFSLEVDGKLSRENGNYSKWVSKRSITQVGGLNTLFAPGDDVFEISGTASGELQLSGRTFQWAAETSSPLVKKFSCPWLIKGILSFKKGNRVTGTLDYGNGECDNQATLTVNGTGRIITLD